MNVSLKLLRPAGTTTEAEAWIARFKLLAGASATIDVSQACSLSEFDLSKATAATVFATVAEPRAVGVLDCNVSVWRSLASYLIVTAGHFITSMLLYVQTFMFGLALLSARCPVADKLKGGRRVGLGVIITPSVGDGRFEIIKCFC